MCCGIADLESHVRVGTGPSLDFLRCQRCDGRHVTNEDVRGLDFLKDRTRHIVRTHHVAGRLIKFQREFRLFVLDPGGGCN